MNLKEYQDLNGERIAHTVWVLDGKGRPLGMKDQSVDDIPKWFATHIVVKVEANSYTLESKAREVARWGD